MPTPDPTSIGPPPKLQQWSLGTGKQPHWSLQENSFCHPRARQHPMSRTSSHPTTTTYKADSCRGKGDSGKTSRTGRQGREGHRRRGKLRPSRDLHDAGPARPCDRSHCSLRHQNGWPLFFCITVLFLQGDGFTKFASEEIATARSRHNSCAL